MVEDAEAARADGDDETADYLENLAPQVVPTEDQLANTFLDKEMTEDEEAQWNDLWLEVTS